MLITITIKNSSPFNQNVVLFKTQENFLKPNFGNMINISILECKVDEEYEQKYGRVNSYRDFLTHSIHKEIIINNNEEKKEISDLNVFSEALIFSSHTGTFSYTFNIKK